MTSPDLLPVLLLLRLDDRLLLPLLPPDGGPEEVGRKTAIMGAMFMGAPLPPSVARRASSQRLTPRARLRREWRERGRR